MQTLETASSCSFALSPAWVALYFMEIVMGTEVHAWPVLSGTRNSGVGQERMLVKFRNLQVRLMRRNRLAVLYDSTGIVRGDPIIVIWFLRSQRPM